MNPAITGATVCRMHGGNAPQVRRAAARRQAEDVARRTLLRLVGEDGGATLDDPILTLRLLGGRIDELLVDLEQSIERNGRTTVDFMGVERVAPDFEVWTKMLGELRRLSTDLAKLGLDERRTQVSELAESRQWLDLRSAILDALRPHPEAYRAMVVVLETALDTVADETADQPAERTTGLPAGQRAGRVEVVPA